MQLEVRRWWGDLLLDVQWYGATAARVDDPSGELLVLRKGDGWELPDVGPVGRETVQTCCPPYRLELQLVDPPPRLLPDGGRADRLDLRGIQADLFDAGLVVAMIVVVLLLVPWTAPPVLQILPPEAEEEPEPERVVQLISARALQEMTLELDHTPPDARSGSLHESPGAAGDSGRRNGSRRSVIRTPSPGVDVGSAGILGISGSLLGGLDPDALAATARGAGTGAVGYGVAGGTGLGARGDSLYAGGSAETLEMAGRGSCIGHPDQCAGALGAKREGGIGTVGGDPICMCNALDRTQIKEVIDRHMNAIRYCWQRSVQRGDTEPGKLVVQFDIAKDGSVARAVRDPSSTLAEGEVSACVVGRFQRMRFPPDPRWGVVAVRYPLLYSL